MVTHGNPYMSCPWDLKQEFGPLKDLAALENIMSFSSWGLLGQKWLLLFWNYNCTKAHRTSNFLDHLYFYQIDLLKKLTSSSEPFLLYSSQVITRHDMTSFKGRFQVLLCGLGGAPKICNLFYGKIYFRKGGRGPRGGEPPIPHFFLHQKQVLFGLKASFLAHFWLV